MTPDGTKILNAIRQMQKFYRSVSLLLKTADAAMDERGWKNARKDSAVLYEMSWSINSPDQWMAREVFRFYKHPGSLSLLASISVLLDDAEKRLAEPVIAGALFDCGRAQMVAEFPIWVGSVYKDVPGRESNGELFEVASSQLEPIWRSKFEFERLWCFATPLVRVNSETDLRQKVVDPLFAKINALA